MHIEIAWRVGARRGEESYLCIRRRVATQHRHARRPPEGRVCPAAGPFASEDCWRRLTWKDHAGATPSSSEDEGPTAGQSRNMHRNLWDTTLATNPALYRSHIAASRACCMSS